jgi:hypothetical protein
MATEPLKFKLGKHPPKHDDRTLQFKTYMKATLPAPPATETKWTSKIPPTGWGMMGNATYGDCTCAAAGHMILEWTANTLPKPVVVPEPVILKFYDHFSGGNPDAGANMLDVLNYWRTNGLNGHKIQAFVQLTLKNESQVKSAVSIFGNCYIGVALPNFAVSPPPGKNNLDIPWVVPAGGPKGNAAPNPNNGHCIPAVGYDENNLYIVTWGQLKPMSWEFYTAYADENFAVLSGDWLKKNKAPSGFDMPALEKDLSQIPGLKGVLV